MSGWRELMATRTRVDVCRCEGEGPAHPHDPILAAVTPPPGQADLCHYGPEWCIACRRAIAARAAATDFLGRAAP